MKKNKYVILFIIVILFSLFSCNVNKAHFRVRSTSMDPNLKPNDVVKIDKSDKQFDYGDIIVCYQEGLGEDKDIIAISRIVGLPNDSIMIKYDICVINNKENEYSLKQKSKKTEYNLDFNEYEEIFPNGEKVLILHSPFFEREEDITKTIKIPADHYFIMGDNRDNSYDSRYFGTIPQKKIIGKVKEIYPSED